MPSREGVAGWLIAGVLVIIGIAFVGVFANVSQKTHLQLGGQVLSARIANTDAQRSKGLSGVRQLGSNEAMLFVFDSSDRWSIWMKDMHINIDAVWLDESKKVIHIETNLTPDSYPLSFAPDAPARYVVELPAGFTKRHNIEVGAIAAFNDRQ